jgi:diguanylate cyclase (GGDEF)-like protein
VQTRLVAAERVTALHRQVADFRSQLERANLQLLGLSLTDPLTGLGNRRRMEQDLESTHARAMRTGRPYAITMFDIDHFKLYNDHYGHPAGDEALRRVAQCLEYHARAGESVYRYGGEEFLLLLPDCHEQALEAAVRIGDAITELAIPHETRPFFPRLVTLSGGVATWSPGSALSASELLKLADKALFRTKSTGRNRVEESTVPTTVSANAH